MFSKQCDRDPNLNHINHLSITFTQKKHLTLSIATHGADVLQVTQVDGKLTGYFKYIIVKLETPVLPVGKRCPRLQYVTALLSISTDSETSPSLHPSLYPSLERR